ncbi:MAG TPA: glycosyltransferase [Candidatus Ozemobacteraceae bacterium]|nr:glycosyltransferase [Candidatus Ozemobacteraceae bacterium]HQG27285.1 glycosyltransferase [Candidatus Ozemobacteraceae bacterium]
MKRIFSTHPRKQEGKNTPQESPAVTARPLRKGRPVSDPRSEPAGKRERICFECDVSSLTASGRYGRELLLASRGIELPLSLQIRKSYDHDDAFVLPNFLETLAQRPPIGSTRMVCLPAFALPERVENGRYWALTAFNPERLSDAERRALRRPERLFVPTEAHAARLVKEKISKSIITVLEPAVNPGIFTPNAVWPAERLDKGKAFTFIAVISPLRRHGIDLLLRAWVEEFRAGEPVRLVLKLSHLPRLKKRLPYEISDLAMRLGALNRLFAPVSVLEGFWAEDDLAGLVAGSNVLVCPDRLPFTGFRIREAVACGVPVIAPESVRSVVPLDEKTGYLVETHEVEQPAESLFPGSPACRVAEPDVAALRRRMREAFGSAAEARRRGEEAARRSAKQTDWENRARLLLRQAER